MSLVALLMGEILYMVEMYKIHIMCNWISNVTQNSMQQLECKT